MANITEPKIPCIQVVEELKMIGSSKSEEDGKRITDSRKLSAPRHQAVQTDLQDEIKNYAENVPFFRTPCPGNRKTACPLLGIFGRSKPLCMYYNSLSLNPLRRNECPGKLIISFIFLELTEELSAFLL